MNIRDEFTGKVLTVLGPISADVLGFTQPHEHLLIDASVYYAEPVESSKKFMAYQPVNLETLRWVRYHPRHNLDNSRLWDVNLAIKELMPYKLAGGKTIVDVTSSNSGRDPMGLAHISRVTGLSIVMGCGHYVTSARNPGVEAKTQDELATEIISDITIGAGNTGIRSGIIGEVGCSWPLRDHERNALRAAAYAQRQTGLAINIHPSRNENGPLDAINILQEAGANLERVVISHMDRCGYLLETRLKILEAGCYVEYDLFGWEGWYPADAALADEHLPDIPNDVARIKEIADLIEMGYLERILISHDIAYKHMLASYGGGGYAHIIENVIPLMRIYGYSEDQIRALTVENPKQMLIIK